VLKILGGKLSCAYPMSQKLPKFPHPLQEEGKRNPKPKP